MAQLIKPNIRPQKWLLARQFHKIPLKEMVSEKHALVTNHVQSLFKHGRNLAKSSVKDYCLLKETYKEAGFNRSMRRYQANLAIEAILVMVQWQKNLKKEAFAIETLAQKIAAHITSSPHSSEISPSRLDEIERELGRFLTWHVAVPKNIFEETNRQYQDLATFIEHETFLKAHKNKHGAELLVYALDHSFSFDFCDEDIDKILTSIQNQLLSERRLL